MGKHFNNLKEKSIGGNRSSNLKKNLKPKQYLKYRLCISVQFTFVSRDAESVLLRSDTEVLQQCVIVCSVLLKGWILGVLTQREKIKAWQ